MNTFHEYFEKLQEKEPKYDAHGWIQWKGTDVCMDVTCKCGEGAHIDAMFFYAYKCSACGTVYAVSQVVKLIELSSDEIEGLGYHPQTGDIDL